VKSLLNGSLKYMKEALKEAQKAQAKDCVPIGAIIEMNGKIIARAHNGRFWHAEILAIKKGEKKFGKLVDATIYITVEPCKMCMHAIKLARISAVIFAAENKNEPLAEPDIIEGLCQEEASALMKEFFKKKR